MELMMFIGNDCLGTIPVDQGCITRPGYLSSLVRQLKQKHMHPDPEMKCEPEFILRDELNEKKLGTLLILLIGKKQAI